jgi:FlaA1/EpsC-like NDP-sugar epimerase
MSTLLIRELYSPENRMWRRWLEYFLDTATFAVSGFLAFELRFDGIVPVNYLRSMKLAICIWIFAKLVAFIGGGLDKRSWRSTSTYDTVRIVCINLIGSIFGGLIIFLVLGPRGVPRSVYILDWLVSSFLTLGSRIVVSVVATASELRRPNGDKARVLIYGAGAAGLALLWEIRQNHALKCEVIGFIDDDRSKAHLILQGKRVLGTGEDLKAVVQNHAIKRVFIAIPSATGSQMVRILKFALDAGVEYKMVPGLGDLIAHAGLSKQLRDVAVEDLLGRNLVHLDQDSIRERIQGRVVMVTGAAGSIGSEICRQIARFDPLALIGFDEAETPLFQIDRELQRTYPHVVFHPEIGNITHAESLRRVMQRYGPSIVYHAAAYKHVPMMERHVFAAVENNIFGTWQVAQAAIAHGVEDFVMISTDKAVRPTSVMGATKRVAELVIRSLQKDGETKFVSVRFGNVLGSKGSVVPIFKEQIAAGGPLTVTHPDMCRYFMTIPEAAQLVLEAFSIGKGGEVFVLEMGEPVKIVDLAKNLILLSGLQPGKDITIDFTGLRPGEKLFEELNLQDERLDATSHPKIRSYICPLDLDPKQMKVRLRELHGITNEQDVRRLLLFLKDLIPDYNPGSQLLRTALFIQSNKADPAIRQIPLAQNEISLAPAFAPAIHSD